MMQRSSLMRNHGRTRTKEILRMVKQPAESRAVRIRHYLVMRSDTQQLLQQTLREASKITKHCSKSMYRRRCQTIAEAAGFKTERHVATKLSARVTIKVFTYQSSWPGTRPFIHHPTIEFVCCATGSVFDVASRSVRAPFGLDDSVRQHREEKPPAASLLHAGRRREARPRRHRSILFDEAPESPLLRAEIVVTFRISHSSAAVSSAATRRRRRTSRCVACSSPDSFITLPRRCSAGHVMTPAIYCGITARSTVVIAALTTDVGQFSDAVDHMHLISLVDG